jgi:hypothetical protein
MLLKQTVKQLFEKGKERAKEFAKEKVKDKIEDVAYKDRITDALMDFGDKHIGGPFKKGGGDEQATRSLISEILSPGKWYSALWDITLGSESTTATKEQDTPGFSQLHGVQMPAPAKVNLAPQQQGGSSNHQPSAAAPVAINPNSEVHAAESHSDHSGIGANEHEPSGGNPSVEAPTAASNASAQSTASSAGPNKATNQGGLQAQVPLVQVGEGHWVPGPTFNTNAQGTPTAAPAPASAPTPAPAPTPAQHDHDGHPTHDVIDHEHSIHDWGGPDHASDVASRTG